MRILVRAALFDVIESHHSVTTVVTGPAPQRQPKPAEPATAARDLPSRAGSGRPVPELEALRVLAEQYGTMGDEARSRAHKGLGLRASQAVNAYSATERYAEREYVARFLGVDDWV